VRDVEKEYREAIAARLSCPEEEVFFYWKGRVALYGLLKAMGIGPGDEVLMQGYTCVVVPNAVLYLGATPVYADIDPDTYNFDLGSLRAKVSERTRVIICQNTYGLSSHLEEIEEIAREAQERFGHPVYTIEDCTHGFGGSYHGKPNGISCDASFFSTQWSKPYTTGVGGFCAVHNAAVREKLKEVNRELVQPGFKEKAELKLMYFIRQYVINDFTYWPMIRVYRWMSRKNLVVGSSSGEEVTGTEMPEGFFKAQSSVQYKKGLKSLKKLDEVNRLRKRNAGIYTEFLKKQGKTSVGPELFDDHIFIRYPLLVKDREEFREKAEKAKIILGEWFEAPVYPAYASLSLWKVDERELPSAMVVCEHMVNLPTEEKHPEKVVRFLEKHLEYIL